MNSTAIRVEDMDLGDLLMKFFRFYGFLFNYYNVGISLQDGGSYFKVEQDLKETPSNKNNLFFKISIQGTLTLDFMTEPHQTPSILPMI